MRDSDIVLKLPLDLNELEFPYNFLISFLKMFKQPNINYFYPRNIFTLTSNQFIADLFLGLGGESWIWITDQY